MTPEAQRIAIAEACGWLKVRGHWEKGGVSAFPDDHSHHMHLPDYLNDLNTCAQFEKDVDDESYTAMLLAVIHKVDADYFNKLRWEHGFELATATAPQRCEAFLRTIGKWEETKQ